jgi:hypothetical protein
MFFCPNCGEEVPDDAGACPHCGSDAETGWSPDEDDAGAEFPTPEDAADADDADTEDEVRPPERRGVSNPFAFFVAGLGILGLIALGGFHALGSPYGLLAAAVLVALVLLAARKARAA